MLILELSLLVVSVFLTTIIGLGSYAYLRDMKYLKERLTDLTIYQKERFDDHEERVRALEMYKRK